MGYTKERVKLEKLLVKIKTVNSYDEKSLATLILTHEQYSHTVRILKNKEPEIFTAHYTNELQAVKDGKKLLKESETAELKQQNFTAYKEVLIKALQQTIAATLAIV